MVYDLIGDVPISPTALGRQLKWFKDGEGRPRVDLLRVTLRCDFLTRSHRTRLVPTSEQGGRCRTLYVRHQPSWEKI